MLFCIDWMVSWYLLQCCMRKYSSSFLRLSMAILIVSIADLWSRLLSLVFSSPERRSSDLLNLNVGRIIFSRMQVCFLSSSINSFRFGFKLFRQGSCRDSQVQQCHSQLSSKHGQTDWLCCTGQVGNGCEQFSWFSIWIVQQKKKSPVLYNRSENQ